MVFRRSLERRCWVAQSNKYKSPTGIDTRGDLGGRLAFPAPSLSYVSANLRAIGWDGLSNMTVGLGLILPFGTPAIQSMPVQYCRDIGSAAAHREQANRGLQGQRQFVLGYECRQLFLCGIS